MALPFDPLRIGGMELPNRLVRSATWEAMAEHDGSVTPRLEAYYDRLAAGGIGLVISSYLTISGTGRQNPDQIGAHRDDHIEGLAKLAQVTHRHRRPLVGQIVHCGGQSQRSASGGAHPVAPSAVKSRGYPEVPQAMTLDEIERVTGDFAQAARRVQRAGFDGVQLHGAHGYLLSEFLSPSRNQRTDRYGGSLENRARFALEVYAAVRDAVGPDFPVLIKLNASDFLPGSTEVADAAYLASRLGREGVDAIEVSGGTPGSGRLGAARAGIAEVSDEAYFLPQAREIRAAAPGTPLILVGGLRSLEVIVPILASGDADAVALCRPLIREPELPRRWQRGDGRKALCISCLGCFGPARRGEGVRCVEEEP